MKQNKKPTPARLRKSQVFLWFSFHFCKMFCLKALQLYSIEVRLYGPPLYFDSALDHTSSLDIQ